MPSCPTSAPVPAGRGRAGHLLTSADGAVVRRASCRRGRSRRALGSSCSRTSCGLFSFYERLAEAFAASGYDAVAIDYFGRTAGTEPRDADWEYMPHVEQTKPEQIRDDVAAAVELLRRSATWPG